MKMLGITKITIPKNISDSIKGYVIVHKNADSKESTYQLEYKVGE